MIEIEATIVAPVPTDNPDDTVWEQHLLTRILRDALDSAGYGDASLNVELLMGKTSQI